jgi:hypothetical protein
MMKQQRTKMTTCIVFYSMLLVMSCKNVLHVNAENEACYLCPNDNSIPSPDAIALDPGSVTERSCRDFAMESLFTDLNDERCHNHYRYIGYTKCECDFPTSSGSSTSQCDLCPPGTTLDEPDAIFDADLGTTCLQTQDYLMHYNNDISDSLCTSFQATGALNCQCSPPVGANGLQIDKEIETGPTDDGSSESVSLALGLGFAACALLVGGFIIKRKKSQYTTATAADTPTAAGAKHNDSGSGSGTDSGSTNHKETKLIPGDIFLRRERKYDILTDDGSYMKYTSELNETDSSSYSDNNDSGNSNNTQVDSMEDIGDIGPVPLVQKPKPERKDIGDGKDKNKEVFKMEEARTTPQDEFPISLNGITCASLDQLQCCNWNSEEV